MTPKKDPSRRIVCHCLGVTEAEIHQAVLTHRIQDVADIVRYTEAGGGCTSCHPKLKECLERCGAQSAFSPSPNCSVK